MCTGHRRPVETFMWATIAIVLCTMTSRVRGADVPEASDDATTFQLIDIPGDAFFSGRADYPYRSPFAEVRWDGETPSVLVDQQWHEYVGINGVKVQTIWGFCKARLGKNAKKRFAEDQLAVLELLGHKVGNSATLMLRSKKGDLITLEVPVTRENYIRVWNARNVDPQDDKPGNWLVEAMRRLVGGGRQQVLETLTAAQVNEDLDFFEQRLRGQFAYLQANHVDLKAAVDAVREKGRNGMTGRMLALELQKIMSKFIDGHASVRGWVAEPSGALPFLLEQTGEDAVAVKGDRSSLVASDYPYISRIDGKTLAEWSQHLSSLFAEGSPQFVQYQTCRHLRSIQFCRSLAGIEVQDTVEVELLSRDKARAKVVTLPVAFERSMYGLWPRHPETRQPAILPENIAYLPIRAMDHDAVPIIVEWMQKFEDTKGLIVDVRGNGGGTRTPLLTLLPLLMSPDEKPYIASVAKYRLYEKFPANHMDGRYMKRANDPRLSEPDRAVITEFSKTFKSQWAPPAEEFSPWHYLVVSRENLRTQGLGDFYYDRPVVVLHDQRCFSATDIFLGAFKGRPRVTLMGQASSGGSAYSQSFDLPKSNIRVQCASMASFQRNGRLYDTNGIHPDIPVVPSPEYFLNDGPDDVLQAAVRFLEGSEPVE